MIPRSVIHLVCSLVVDFLGMIFHVIRNLLGGGFKYFLFSPRTLGKWSNLTHIFQTGWFNHQLVYILGKSLELSNLYLFSPLKKSLEFCFFITKIKLTKSAKKREFHPAVFGAKDSGNSRFWVKQLQMMFFFSIFRWRFAKRWVFPKIGVIWGYPYFRKHPDDSRLLNWWRCPQNPVSHWGQRT